MGAEPSHPCRAYGRPRQVQKNNPVPSSLSRPLSPVICPLSHVPYPLSPAPTHVVHTCAYSRPRQVQKNCRI